MTGLIITVGLGNASAEDVVALARDAGATHIVDVRRRPWSQRHADHSSESVRQLARRAGLRYVHLEELAPTVELLDAVRSGRLAWDKYAERYKLLLISWPVSEAVARLVLVVTAGGRRPVVPALLCAEERPQKCHRRLLAEWTQHLDSSIAVGHAHHGGRVTGPPRQAGLEEFW